MFKSTKNHTGKNRFVYWQTHNRWDDAFRVADFAGTWDTSTYKFLKTTYGPFRAINDAVMIDSPIREIVQIVRRETGAIKLAPSMSRALLVDIEAQMSGASPDACDRLEDKAIRVELGVRLLARYFKELASFALQNYFRLVRQRTIRKNETRLWLEVFDLSAAASRFLLEGIAGLRPEGPPH